MNNQDMCQLCGKETNNRIKIKKESKPICINCCKTIYNHSSSIEIEAINLINKLNEEIFETLEEDDWPFFEFSTNGYQHLIKFIDITIWNSEDDEDYEPLEGFVRRETQKILDNLSKLNFIKVTDEDNQCP